MTYANTQPSNGSSSGDRVWLITGCSTGFGRALADAVLAKGDRLIATARHPDQLQDLVESHQQQVHTLSLDVTDLDNIRSAVAEAQQVFGRIDVLVNNAGYGTLGAIEEVSDEAIRQQYDTNVFGTLNMMRAILPIMRQQRHGHILNLSSVGGMVAFAGSGIYCSTKFAIEGMSEALSKEVAPLGIKVTIVEPGAFRTDFSGRSISVPEQQISDYADTAGKFTERAQQIDGQQPGDPAKASLAMVQAVESDAPPLRLALGEDAVSAIEQKLQSVKAELDQWRSVSLNTAFEGATAGASGG